MMRTILRSMTIMALSLFGFQTAFANNVVVSNISLTGQDAANDFTFVQFDITWENSWRVSGGPSNHDAAWVFVKFSTDGGATWRHATLATSGHTGPSGSIIDTPADGKGVFIFRDANGSGTNSWNGVQLKWDYGADGVVDNATVKVKVFAIEMVLVPQAAFAAGSGGTGIREFTLTTINTATATTVPSGSGSLGGQAGGFPTGQTAPSNASWPNGFNAFYMMKYEISMDQYKDFLNCLTSTQAATRNPGASTFRYGITGSHPNFSTFKPFVGSTPKPFVACNFLSWMDGAAYADWAGLRPMTELEFEKACRGNLTPVANEFAWGTTNITAATGISNDGAANEVPSNAGANCAVGDSGTNGPLRVGSFATSSSTREQAGASFYGIMELSGNLWERPVTIGNVGGRLFTGTLGDGSLSAAGNATNGDWPGINAGEVTGASGSGFRGGNWIDDSSIARVSDRNFAAITITFRNSDIGFRCVRPEP